MKEVHLLDTMGGQLKDQGFSIHPRMYPVGHTRWACWLGEPEELETEANGRIIRIHQRMPGSRGIEVKKEVKGKEV